MSTFLFKEHLAILTNKEFEKLSDFVYSQCGIKMPPIKKTMLETRLRKRLRACGMGSFTEYIDYLFSSRGMNEELIHMIDVVTTNKTDFFREPAQFTYLVQKGLPYLTEELGINHLKFWSAGCSTGEEPYTIAMVLSDYCEEHPALSSFSILATDISTKVLETASTGIYDSEKVIPVPFEMKKKYLLRSKDRSKDLVKVSHELRQLVSFQRLNFMDDDFGIREKKHIIFCRNVIIYFDKPMQERLLKKLFSLIIPGGYLFLGHSETIFSMDIPMEQVAPSTYRKI
jgi:chemotaxis protein methyltransferase CheR